MPDIFGQQTSEIVSFIGGLISGGVGGSLLTLRFTRQNHVRGSGSVIDQSAAKAGGDIVGGNKAVSRDRRP